MVTTPGDLYRAEARVEAARARLGATVGTLQAKLEPAVLARTAVATVTDGGHRALAATTAGARRNPARIAGAVALIALVLARKRIGRALSRRGGACEAAQPDKQQRVRIRRSDPPKRNLYP